MLIFRATNLPGDRVSGTGWWWRRLGPLFVVKLNRGGAASASEAEKPTPLIHQGGSVTDEPLAPAAPPRRIESTRNSRGAGSATLEISRPRLMVSFFPELLVCSHILFFVAAPLASRDSLLGCSDCPQI